MFVTQEFSEDELLLATASYEETQAQASAESEGNNEDLTEGWREAWIRDWIEGFRQGQFEVKLEIAQKLLVMQLPISDIMKVTELTHEIVCSLQASSLQ